MAEEAQFDSRQGQEIAPFAQLSHSALEPTQSSVQGVQASLTSGINRLEREVGIHLHLAPSLRMSGLLPSSPHTFERRAQGLILPFTVPNMKCHIRVK